MVNKAVAQLIQSSNNNILKPSRLPKSSKDKVKPVPVHVKAVFINRCKVFAVPVQSSGTGRLASSHLKTSEWQLLLGRIGEPLMTYLLTTCSIFAPLANGCLLQLCGKPINDVST